MSRPFQFHKCLIAWRLRAALPALASLPAWLGACQTPAEHLPGEPAALNSIAELPPSEFTLVNGPNAVREIPAVIADTALDSSLPGASETSNALDAIPPVTMPIPGTLPEPVSLDPAPPFSFPGLNPPPGQEALPMGGGSGDNGIGGIGTVPANAPPITSDGSVVTTPNTPVIITLMAIDPEGQDLTFSMLFSGEHGTIGPLDNSPPNSATLTYTPHTNYVGPDVITFVVRDSSEVTVTSRVFISIAPVNQPPIAQPQSVNVLPGVGRTVVLAGSDPESSTLSYRVVQSPAHGTLSGSPPQLTYSALLNYVGSDTFTFVVNDGQQDSVPATVSIGILSPSSVLPPSVPPLLNITAAEDTPVPITLTGSDANGLDLTFSIAIPPTMGTVSAINNLPASSASFTYTPAAHFNGTVTFTYVAFNGLRYSSAGNCTITFTPVNDAPVIDAGTTCAQPVAMNSRWTNAGNQLTLSATDPDAVDYSLYWTISRPASHGTATVPAWSQSASGTPKVISYMPQPGYSGPDSYDIRVDDVLGGVATLRVNVTVIGTGAGWPAAGSLKRTDASGVTTAASGVTMTFAGTGSWTGVTATAISDGNGVYGALLPSGWTGTVAQSAAADWRLVPVSRALTNVQSVVTNLDFAAARNFYVDRPGDGIGADGDDNNPGTMAAPFASPQKAAGVVIPGDTVRIRAGTYTNTSSNLSQPVLQVNASGTITAPITFQAHRLANGEYENVVFDGLGTHDAVVWLYGCKYVALDSITVTGGRQYGILLGYMISNPPPTRQFPAEYILVKSCVAHHNMNTTPATWYGGFHVVAGSHDVTLDHCESYANGSGFWVGFAHDTNAANQPSRVSLLWCLAHDNMAHADNSDGFSLFGLSSSLLSHCVAYNNADDNFQTQGPFADNNVFEYCVAINANPTHDPAGNGDGFKIGNINNNLRTAGFVGAINTVVRNCLSIGNWQRGFEDTEGSQGGRYINNVALGNGEWGFLTDTRMPVRATLLNNIGYQNGLKSNAGNSPCFNFKYQCVYGDTVLFGNRVALSDYNYWSDLSSSTPFNNNRVTSADGQVVEPHSRAGNPLFVNPVIPTNPVSMADVNLWVGPALRRVPNPAFGDVPGLRLQSGSPCLDAGTNAAQPYGLVGSGYDMGAFEK